MLSDCMSYSALIEIGCVFGSNAVESIEQQRAQGSPKPVVRGNIEARLAAPDYGSWQPFLHQLLEDELLLLSPDFQLGWQCRRKFHNAMVEKRRTHLHGMSHAHPVHLA